jgi:methylthioribose-1-phosphate isomerase
MGGAVAKAGGAAAKGLGSIAGAIASIPVAGKIAIGVIAAIGVTLYALHKNSAMSDLAESTTRANERLKEL